MSRTMAPNNWSGSHMNEAPNDISNYIFFLSKEEVPYGCFSNAFRETTNNGHMGLSEAAKSNKEESTTATATAAAKVFWCVNQELHYRKAILFGDNETAGLILEEREDAGKIKQLGRLVKGYDDAKWTAARYDVARDAVHAKFANDAELKDILLGTGNKMIVEAAKDKAWGIGCVEFSSGDAKGAKSEDGSCWDVPPAEWPGENLLGRCLMDVRKLLAEE